MTKGKHNRIQPVHEISSAIVYINATFNIELRVEY